MYLYHANAIALGIGNDAHAVCALPYTGGKATLQQSIQHSSDGISCKIVKSEVESKEEKIGGADVYITSASVELVDINILDILKTDRIHATIISTHQEGDSDLSFEIADSDFGKLEIAGHSVTLERNHQFEKSSKDFNTYSEMQKAFAAARKPASATNPNANPVLGVMMGNDLHDNTTDPEDIRCAYKAYEKQEQMSQLGLTVVCSLVKSVKWTKSVSAPKGLETWGPIIKLSNARIYLGELVIWPWMRCLNMFRIEVDPKEKTTSQQNTKPQLTAKSQKEILRISGGTVGANGSTYPPSYVPPPPPPGGDYGGGLGG